ncbi:hypothetical protein HGQ17_02360 [Nesterenkonia sp. MY13]|uniref:Uncharacterized protein n=1 Tax=Nesterenkonia sedimenti TaxID=1463632 RepID=A0A7X8YD00_9MICC|nr:hypothetical protein [Nesterenkonia sedimenti]NLS08861.1 hypothetical protein [Nesterenkonia sedimenti]
MVASPVQEGADPELALSELAGQSGGDVEEVDIADGAVILPGNQLGVIDGTQMYLLAGQTTQEDSKEHFIALAEAVTSN